MLGTGDSGGHRRGMDRVGVSDPVWGIKSDAGLCAKCCDRGLHRDSGKRYLSCRGSPLRGGDP